MNRALNGLTTVGRQVKQGLGLGLRKDPWTTYKSGIKYAFGLTMVANVGTSLADMSPVQVSNNPQAFGAGLLAKSMWFGVIWPAIPLMVVMPDGLRNYAVFGSGMKKQHDRLEKEFRQLCEGLKQEE